MARKQDPFFPSIGSAVEQVDRLPEEDEPKPVDVDGAQPKTENEDDEDRPLKEMSSLCMACGEQGTTRMLLTNIPYFREVIVMSFRCEHCGNQNNEVQSAGMIRDQGVLYTAKILIRSDLNRQLVKSSHCTISIPEFELTIPPGQGQLNTVEGIIRDTIRDLSADQPLRRIQDEETWRKLEAVLEPLKEIVRYDEDDEDAVEGPGRDAEADAEEKLARPFTIKVDDPAGDSFIEFIGSMKDPKWSMRTYNRTLEQNIAMGLVAAKEESEKAEGAKDDAEGEEDEEKKEGEEIYVFPGICSSCGHAIDTKMKKVIIPYFKDIFIMSTNCDRCGYRDNEVKSGAAISEKGRKITLRAEDAEDLSRDVLKSETCGMEIPEIDFVLQPGTLGGRFTTLEGILNQVYEQLSEKVFAGDSSRQDAGEFTTFLGKLKKVMAAEHPFTLILDDPLANSYLQNLYAPDPDPNMKVEMYERSWQQNEDLGLNDMKVEGYEEGEKETQAKAA
ncbi:hypothetical protein BOTBODRAFT_28115 [Botryobasidium botryosum FD-172 SS1]|uniref:Zinc finger ZPR1-type domain-containing protein n=1 Tax=Botryobasidium botryosum (strain FD-172 SS1) TaxID=930990 RepID=A0A067N6X7_BOTB1|nr:hypothetical protein BOTBODRAFT_28115 [Botryobasidium botryosum FD-172 SS1]